MAKAKALTVRNLGWLVRDKAGPALMAAGYRLTETESEVTSRKAYRATERVFHVRDDSGADFLVIVRRADTRPPFSERSPEPVQRPEEDYSSAWSFNASGLPLYE